MAQRSTPDETEAAALEAVGLDVVIQIDGQQLKGDAQMIAKGHRLSHLYHMTPSLTILHSSTTLSQPSCVGQLFSYKLSS